tara:strand:+ start:180 stop:602 length:423 start_codon:yes stop_codon:yes gene_type:complete
MQTFKRDLQRGKYHENIILDIIKSKYSKAYIKDGYCKEYDIYVPEMNFGVEVKSDEKSKYTNNIVIEIEFNSKPSALSTTKAKYWVIYDGYVYNWFLTQRLKDCIKDNNLKYVEFIGKGDTKSKKAYLIKKEVLYKYKQI